MSEEILKALMQLFAIISKQDEGVNKVQQQFVNRFLITQLTKEKVEEYLKIFEDFAGFNEEKKPEPAPVEGEEKKEKKLTSMKDSVRTLAICKKINKTLTQKQKVVVFIRCYELVNSDNQFTEQRISILNTIGEVFNIEAEEAKYIDSFIRCQIAYELNHPNHLIIDTNKPVADENTLYKHITTDTLNGFLSIINVPSAQLYFLRFLGDNDIYLNGLQINPNNIYLFAPGSTLRLPAGTVYYSEVVAKYSDDNNTSRITLNVNELWFTFPNGTHALRNINLSEKSGTLVGIMGASGAGKTTLLNVISGIEKPTQGEVLVNGINIHKDKKAVEGVIGYISQDDLLIEELSVFQNLYYNAKLCFKNLTEQELTDRVIRTLDLLGLEHIKDVIVGSPLNKKISGGQRKRLNIALELIREPAVLFVDEPTSGLSSRDSENVMDLLKQLTLKGKLIFVVIHQPSSDIYKMFDKMYILDTGGYPTYYGHPIEAVMYFKQAAQQVNAEVGECHTCGNVNPETIFNIIDAKAVDEYGNYTHERKLKPNEWNEVYKQKIVEPKLADELEKPQIEFEKPGALAQFKTFITRDVLAKLSNKQYLYINLLEMPLLAFILAFIIRYVANYNHDEYLFRENENIPAYIFMSIIVSLFVGLTISAEEIFKDLKILKREQFLALSRGSYLFSKITILFTITALQAAMFVFIGNGIIGLKGMYLTYWLMLFTTGCCANLIGLNISASFNSAVTIYILIPLLVIPQMILGGAMFSFDKINKYVGGGFGVPPVADAMVSRWAYEGLITHQFLNNNYQEVFNEFEFEESKYNYYTSYYIPELQRLTEVIRDMKQTNGNDSLGKVKMKYLTVINTELKVQANEVPSIKFAEANKINMTAFNKDVASNLKDYLQKLYDYYSGKFNEVNGKQEKLVLRLNESREKIDMFNRVKNNYYNENVADIVKKSLNKHKVAINGDGLFQIVDPIFKPSPNSSFSFRSHFYAPSKYFFGKEIPTVYFNMIVIWLMTVFLAVTLYYDGLKKLLNVFSKPIPLKK